MTKIVKGARIVHKRITTTPTVSPIPDHTFGWLETDIYEGELCLDLNHLKAYTRMDNASGTTGGGIIEFVLIDPTTEKIRYDQLPTSILGSVVYQGTWDASTGNPPTLTPQKGWYYVVSVSGNTDLSGITEWKVSDWAIYNGYSWERVDNTEEVIDLTPYLKKSGDTMTGTLIGTNIGLSGNIFVSGMSNSSTSNVVFYDSATGKLTYGGSSTLTPTYTSSLDDNLTVPVTIGGIVSGTTVSQLTGNTFSYLFDSLLFPTIDPTITVAKSASFTPTLTTPVEVGTTVTATLTANYVTGTIKNGGSPTTTTLTGNANTYTFKLPDNSTDGVVSTSSNTQARTFSSYVVTAGNNIWSVQIAHDAGTTAYYDSKGVVSHILDSSRVASTVTANSNTVVAVRYAWWGFGSPHPTNSTGVRALSNKSFLNTSNNGIFSMSIPIGSDEVYFYVPAGKTVVVLYVESSNANVTGAFTTSSITVNDANGTPQSYTQYLSTTSNYPAIATYNVTVS